MRSLTAPPPLSARPSPSTVHGRRRHQPHHRRPDPSPRHHPSGGAQPTPYNRQFLLKSTHADHPVSTSALRVVAVNPHGLVSHSSTTPHLGGPDPDPLVRQRNR